MNRKVAELREVWMLSGKEKSLAPAENLTLNPRNQPVAWSFFYYYFRFSTSGLTLQSAEYEKLVAFR
jgi:hypothetical protein